MRSRYINVLALLLLYVAVCMFVYVRAIIHLVPLMCAAQIPPCAHCVFSIDYINTTE